MRVLKYPKFLNPLAALLIDWMTELSPSSMALVLRWSNSALGYPKSREYLASWTGELAPGLRRGRPAIGPRREKISLEEKIQAVAELEGRDGTAAEVAARHGVAREMPYVWRRQLLLGDNSDEDEPTEDRSSVSERFDKLPTNEAELTQMALELRAEVRRLQTGLDVRSATLETVKKDLGTDPNRLTNREKALLVDSLRGRWKLKELLAAVGMARRRGYGEAPWVWRRAATNTQPTP